MTAEPVRCGIHGVEMVQAEDGAACPWCREVGVLKEELRRAIEREEKTAWEAWAACALIYCEGIPRVEGPEADRRDFEAWWKERGR